MLASSFKPCFKNSACSVSKYLMARILHWHRLHHTYRESISGKYSTDGAPTSLGLILVIAVIPLRDGNRSDVVICSF